MVEGYCYCIVVALTMCSGAANNRTTLVKKSGSYRPRMTRCWEKVSYRSMDTVVTTALKSPLYFGICYMTNYQDPQLISLSQIFQALNYLSKRRKKR